jgi:DNA polymerase-3 subunit epsilon
MLDKLFGQFENIIFLDTETSGLDARREEIIEFGALRLAKTDDGAACDAELNVLLRLSEGRRLPETITKITGITHEQLLAEGVDKGNACAEIVKILDAERPLIVAYNAHFDLCFLYFFLRGFGAEGVLKKAKFLDALTVYKDRQDYPHKLADAIAKYALDAENSHRAIDDAKATAELMYALEREYDDLTEYINLFGYNPKYGVDGPKISSIRYEAQPFGRAKRVYE